MKRTFLYAKLHQARVTHADPDYEGSFAIDAEILEASAILQNEQIHVYNIDNANRFVTYAIRAPRGSKLMGANGACAHLVSPGDRVIICSYAEMEELEWKNHTPKVLFLDENNNFTEKLVKEECN
jgi:aspartate 1-decarboxylase